MPAIFLAGYIPCFFRGLALALSFGCAIFCAFTQARQMAVHCAITIARIAAGLVIVAYLLVTAMVFADVRQDTVRQLVFVVMATIRFLLRFFFLRFENAAGVAFHRLQYIFGETIDGEAANVLLHDSTAFVIDDGDGGNTFVFQQLVFENDATTFTFEDDVIAILFYFQAEAGAFAAHFTMGKQDVLISTSVSLPVL